MHNTEYQIFRSKHLAPQVVIVDGQGGCGKTLFSALIASYDRVELLTYVYEIEHALAVNYLGGMTDDAAEALVRMYTDLKVYNSMMSRETNFRPSDLSGVFRNIRPFRYLNRLFQKGDEHVPGRIAGEQPVLNLTTHNLMLNLEPVARALEDRLVFIEVVRHPLYMLKQQALNFQHIVGSVRDFTIYFNFKGNQIPFYTKGFEQLYINSSPEEKAVYCIKFLMRRTEEVKERLKGKTKAKIITVPFERFVVEPWDYLKMMEDAMGVSRSKTTQRVLKQQKVPRKLFVDGLGLKIYKRCGWVPPQKNSSEESEFEQRWNWFADILSKEALHALNDLCTSYEEKYLGRIYNYPKKGI